MFSPEVEASIRVDMTTVHPTLLVIRRLLTPINTGALIWPVRLCTIDQALKLSAIHHNLCAVKSVIYSIDDASGSVLKMGNGKGREHRTCPILDSYRAVCLVWEILKTAIRMEVVSTPSFWGNAVVGTWYIGHPEYMAWLLQCEISSV